MICLQVLKDHIIPLKKESKKIKESTISTIILCFSLYLHQQAGQHRPQPGQKEDPAAP